MINYQGMTADSEPDGFREAWKGVLGEEHDTREEWVHGKPFRC